MINDADPRAQEWRRKLEQINAEHPGKKHAAQIFFDQLPADPQTFDQLYHCLFERGGKSLDSDDLAEAMGWNAPNFCGNLRRS